MLDHEIRYSTLDDEQYLVKWLSDVENSQWFPVSTEQEIKDWSKNWIGFSKFKSSLTATVENIPYSIGTLFLMPYRKVAHQCLFYMIVDKNYRGQGIGFSMLKNLLNLAKNYFHLELIYAEVFEKCPILPLMAKLNFETFAIQDNFVHDAEGYKQRILLEHYLTRHP